jgi:transcriptional regulator with XRE-family HTH domain
MPEQLGARIARLRAALSLTQHDLAERIAVSRAAVSHFELDLQAPSERTVALLAGVFKIAPHDLVADTYYPSAKAERLPPVVACYTEIELQLRLLEHDLAWIERIAHLPRANGVAMETLHAWLDQLATLHDRAPDRRARLEIDAAQREIQQRIARIRL